MTDCSRTALLLAHSFPPISTAGVFRILRFVKYLPEFGWRPVVVASPTRHGNVLRDEALLKQVPPNTIVYRPSMPNPEAWIGNHLRNFGGGEDHPSPAVLRIEDAASSQPPVPRPWRTWMKKMRGTAVQYARRERVVGRSGSSRRFASDSTNKSRCHIYDRAATQHAPGRFDFTVGDRSALDG